MMADTLFALGSILLGVFLLWEAAQLPRGVLVYALDPALFPRLVAVGLILLGMALLWGGWKKKKRMEAEKSGLAISLVFRFFLLLAVTVGYILLWGRGWFLLNTFCYLFLVHQVLRFGLLPSAGSSLLVALATYLLFTQVFRVRLF